MLELAPVAFVLVFAAIIGLIGWLLVRTVRRNRAPRNPAVGHDLARLAAERGWHYTPRDDEFLRRFDGYPFGRGGQLRPALDLVTGTHRGREFACFQFAPPRSLSPGEGSAEIGYTRVVAVTLPAPVPTLVLSPARSAPRWTRRYTTGDDAFDRTFAVGTEDEPFADHVLTEPVRRWLLANPPAGALRLGGPSLVAWNADTGGFAASMVEPAVAHLSDLLDQIPPDALR
ncbi:MAG TPA: hypothetical protein VH969_08990 [Actinophytocola sp.]|jgi:hypothetical protein|uniref:hypothetical protein n=1 Tax=Actinophytocola sp. TaxID=1872138 RepID=UPI002F94C8DC